MAFCLCTWPKTILVTKRENIELVRQKFRKGIIWCRSGCGERTKSGIFFLNSPSFFFSLNISSFYSSFYLVCNFYFVFSQKHFHCQNIVVSKIRLIMVEVSVRKKWRPKNDSKGVFPKKLLRHLSNVSFRILRIAFLNLRRVKVRVPLNLCLFVLFCFPLAECTWSPETTGGDLLYLLIVFSLLICGVFLLV